MQFLRKGDVLVTTRIDPLARSIRDLQNIVHELKEKGVPLKAPEQPIDTWTGAGQAFLDAVAEFEMNLRKVRQLEGIARAKAESVMPARAASLRSTGRESASCISRALA